MDNSTRTAIILAAVNAAGSDGGDGSWYSRVCTLAGQITAMVRPGSGVAKVVDGVFGAKIFTGEVVSVSKEASSTRGLIVLRTGTDRSFPGVPAGCETIRTDRTDDPTGAGLALARAVKAAVGAKVIVWVDLEENNSKKYRVLRHFEVVEPAPAVAQSA